MSFEIIFHNIFDGFFLSRAQLFVFVELTTKRFITVHLESLLCFFSLFALHPIFESYSLNVFETSNRNFWNYFRSNVAAKTKKTTKETEKERPPWRSAVTTSASKPNKNALLKAKILDATRRALLAQRITHIGTQTESTATLLREKSIGVQNDLILMLDKCEDTDGQITIRNDRPGGCEFICTSISNDPCIESIH